MQLLRQSAWCAHPAAAAKQVGNKEARRKENGEPHRQALFACTVFSYLIVSTGTHASHSLDRCFCCYMLVLLHAAT